jgi:hypothetical protein
MPKYTKVPPYKREKMLQPTKEESPGVSNVEKSNQKSQDGNVRSPTLKELKKNKFFLKKKILIKIKIDKLLTKSFKAQIRKNRYLQKKRKILNKKICKFCIRIKIYQSKIPKAEGTDIYKKKKKN